MRNSLLIVFLMTIGSAQAALIDRGGGFIYDDVLDITWTQNANINGSAYWATSVDWADSLSLYDSVRDVSWDDWRLASMDVDGNQSIVDCSSATEADCRDNELGYMFHQNGVSSVSQGLFTNVQNAWYYSETEWGYANAYYLNFGYGNQGRGDKALPGLYAWAVRDGDVGVVPVPAAVWLFGSALAGLGWVRRKNSV